MQGKHYSLTGFNSPRSAEYQICIRKIAYTEEYRAVVVAYIMEEKYLVRFSSYSCRFCGGFHVGKLKKKEAVPDVPSVS